MTMTKKFTANSLKASVNIAQQQTQDRFDKADVVLSESPIATQQFVSKQDKVSAIQRQSLSVLKNEAELAETMIQEFRDLGFNPNISEIYRAGLKALVSLSFEQRRDLIASLERMKVGRPKK